MKNASNKGPNAKDELLELERRYWQAMKDRDVDTALSLTDDPCLVAGAQGVARIDRDTFADMMNASNYTLEEFRVADDAEVRLLGTDVAVLAYEVHEELRVDGEPLSLDAAEASTWVRRDGRWLCALHAESLLGDPYGRDRN